MSRTTRKFCTEGNHREARKGRTHKMVGFRRIKIKDPAVPWVPRSGGPSRLHGGMLMSPSSTGMWGDEYRPGDIRAKRAVKRAERQAAASEIEQELLADTDPLGLEDEDADEALVQWEDYCYRQDALDAEFRERVGTLLVRGGFGP